MVGNSPVREIRLAGLNEPVRKVFAAPYTAIIEQMESLARRIGAHMTMEKWEDDGAERFAGTAFKLQYQ